MSLMEELVESFLFNNEEISHVYNRVTKEVSMDDPASIIGEFAIDWDDEQATKDLVIIPQITSTEAYDLMVLFAKEQEDAASGRLLEMLKKRKPFEKFKSKLHTLELGDEWYDYENDYAKRKMTNWLSENE